MPLRITLEDFQLANTLYAGASVDVWTVDAALAKTATRATLYAAPTGLATRPNPVTLDSRGKFAQPIYVEVPVILTVAPTTGLAHDTAVTGLVSRWRGVWTAGTLYYPNERVRHPTEGTTYVVLVGHTSGTFTTDLAAAKLEEEWDGASIAEAVADAHGDFLHGATFGLTGDGVTDETVALQAFADACAAQKRVGLLGPGTFITTGLTIKSDCYIRGSGRENTWIKLKAGANGHVVKGENADSLFGTGSLAGIRNFGLFDLGVDGNRANQSPADPNLCSGLAFYGAKPHLHRLTIKEVKGHGMWTGWGSFGEVSGGMEGRIDDILIDVCGRHGWRNAGPHDTYASHIVICDAGQETDNTYDGMLRENYSSAEYYGLHVWHRSTVTNRVRYGVTSIGSALYVGLICEGGRSQFRSTGTLDRLVAPSFFNHRGSAGTAMVVLAASNTLMEEAHFQNTAATDCYAVQIGDGGTAAAGYDIKGVFFGFRDRSPFNFINDGGGNIVGIGSTTSGGATIFGGIISGSSRIAYSQSGTAIEFWPEPRAGRYPDTRGARVGAAYWGAYPNTSAGQRQEARFLLTRDTSGTTAGDLTTNGSVLAANNSPVLEANMAFRFEGWVVAYDLGNGDAKEWVVKGLIKRVTDIASTTLVGSAATSTYADTGASSWSLALAAENSSIGTLKLTATGASGRNIRWLADITCVQVEG